MFTILLCLLCLVLGFLFGNYYSRIWSKKFIENHQNQLKLNLKNATSNFEKVLKDFERQQKEIDRKLIEDYQEAVTKIELEHAASVSRAISEDDADESETSLPFEKPKKTFLH